MNYWLLVIGYWLIPCRGWPMCQPVYLFSYALHNLGQSPCGDLDSPVGVLVQEGDFH